MSNNDILKKVLSDVNELFGKVFSYNLKLLRLCNNDNYEPTSDEVFDFYITSQANSFLKNFFYNYIESPGIFLNARCIIEGLALKVAFKNEYFDCFNLELLKNQGALIEHNQYKKFKECYDQFLIPEELESRYYEAYEFFRKTLCSFSESNLKKIVNSNIPFVCNPKLSFQKIVKDNLGNEWATQYSLLSALIHPTSNENLNTQGSFFALLDTIELLKKEYMNLPSNMDLRAYSNFIFCSRDAKAFLDSIKSECTELESVIEDFKKNYGDNYVSNTFHVISMTIQEMALDTIFGFTEQVKEKWKVLLELLSGFYEIYLNTEDVNSSYRMLQYHEDVTVARSCCVEEEKRKALEKAYEFYKMKYPNGVEIDEFSHKFDMPTGFTIDSDGKIKTLTQLVTQFTDFFKASDNHGVSYGTAMKLNYVEAQMLSHANGYFWYANSGAWTDIDVLFIMFNQLMYFICLCISDLFADSYKEGKHYHDKKTSNLLKHSGKNIMVNTDKLYELLLKRNGKFGTNDLQSNEVN